MFHESEMTHSFQNRDDNHSFHWFLKAGSLKPGY